MVDLPVPQPQLVTSETPQSKIGADAFHTTPLQPRSASIAPGLAALGQGAEDLAVPFAERAAADTLAKAVTRNPDGSINVATPQTSFILGRAGHAYDAAVTTGLVAAQQTQMSADMASMAKDHINDPAGFLKASGDYVDKRRASNPGVLGEAIFRDGSRLAEQHWAGLVDQKATLDVSNAHQAITTQIEDGRNQLAALARQGGTGTPDFIRKSKEIDSLYDSLGTNPLFKISPEKIASEKQRTTDLMQAEATIGKVDSTFNRSGPGGGRAAAQKILEEQILNNPKLNIPEQERNRLYNLGLHRLEYLSGDQKAQVDANRGTVKETLTAIHAGKDLPDGMLDQVIANASKLGDAESVSQLQAARDIYGITRGAAQGTPEQQLNAHFPKSGGLAGMAEQAHGLPPGYLDRTRQIESGSNPTAVSPTGAKGPFQFTSRTWTQFGLGGDPNDIGDSTQAAARLGAANQAQMAPALGRAPTASELYLAHQQGAAGALKLLANPNARAGDLVGDQAIRVNGGDPNAPASAFVQKWAATFNKTPGAPIKNYVAPASVNGVAFTPAQIQQNPFLLSEQVRAAASDDRNVIALAKTVGPGIESGLRAGMDPNPTTLANFYQLADKHPKQLGELRQDIDALVQGNALAAQASGLPIGQGQPLIDEAKRQAQGSSIYQQKLAEQAQSQFLRQTQALATDPMGEGARRGWIARRPIPLDPSSGDAFTQGITERRAAGAMIGSRLGEAPEGLMFSAADKKGMANFLQTSGGEAAKNLLNGLVGGLKPEEMDALMASPDMKAAISGLTRSGDPAKMGAAYGALDAIYRSGNAETFKKDFGADALSDLRYWQSHLAFLPPDQLAKEMRRNDDPGVIKARAELEKQADAGPLKGLTPGQVVKKFGGWFSSAGEPASEAPALTAMALKDDYTQAYRMQYGKTGSATDSDKFATETIGQKWGVSAVNSSRVMAYPPERYYPQVGGSHDWLHRQLGEFVARRAGDQGISLGVPFDEGAGTGRAITMPVTAEQQRNSNIALGDHALVPDAQTQAEIANRQAPGYQVVVRAADGNFHLLTGDDGKAVRFKGDPTQPQAGAREAFEARRGADAALLRQRQGEVARFAQQRGQFIDRAGQ